MKTFDTLKLAILGGGYMGQAIAKGFVVTGKISAHQIILTRRNLHLLEPFSKQGFITKADNCDAIRNAEITIIAVQPQQLDN
jgi:pyrroline-5-carboxylate reductase